MLVGSRWAFIHIPKCGGTTLRHYLRGAELGDIMPLGGACPIKSALHRITPKRPAGRVFTVIRHPAAWLRSYWLDQSPERIGVKRYLHQFWSDDLDEFVANVCTQRAGYVTDLVQASLRYHTIKIFKLEDGLEQVLDWLRVRHGEVERINVSESTQQLSEESLALVAKSERILMRRYGYT